MNQQQPDPQEMAGRAEELRSHLEQASQSLETLTNQRDEKKRALETLRGVKESKVGDEMLVPVGGTTFVNASLEKNDKVLMGVGADYAMPRPIDDAIRSLEGDVEKLASRVEEVSAQAGQLEAEYTSIVQALQSAQRAGGQGGPATQGGAQ